MDEGIIEIGINRYIYSTVNAITVPLVCFISSTSSSTLCVKPVVPARLWRSFSVTISHILCEYVVE